MEIEEVEEKYKNERDDAEKIFVEGIKNKQDFKILEESYRSAVKRARGKYYKTLSVMIAREKGRKVKKKHKPKEKDRGVFRVIPLNADLGFFQRLKVKGNLLAFKVHFAVRNMVRRNTPHAVSFNVTKGKILTKRFFVRTFNVVVQIFVLFWHFVVWSFVKTRVFVKFFFKKTTAVPRRLWHKIFGKKKGGKKEGEDGKNDSSDDNDESESNESGEESESDSDEGDKKSVDE